LRVLSHRSVNYTNAVCVQFYRELLCPSVSRNGRVLPETRHAPAAQWREPRRLAPSRNEPTPARVSEAETRPQLSQACPRGHYRSSDMANTVAVVESAVSFRRGVESALQRAGFDPVDPEGTPSAVLVTLRSTEGCEVVERFAAAGTVVVALLPDPSAAEHAHALGHGAAGTVDWSADPEEIVAVLRVALEGRTRLPVAIARTLAGEWPGAHAPRPEFNEEEIEWIADLARGTPVARLADDTGYSERAMFRRLHDIYTRLGVGNRAEAIVAAERLGLLSEAE